MELGDFGPHLDAELGVEVGERLVEEKDLRVRGRWPGRRPPAAAGRRRAAFGLRSSSSSMPRMSAASRTRLSISCLGVLAELEAEGHVLVHRHVGVEGVVLEDHGDVAVFRRDVVDDPVADEDRPGVGSSRPATMRRVVDLPQPEGPTRTTNSLSSTVRWKSFTAATEPKCLEM